eukprot:Filipodium_phascolosomae@DN736_c0_g1_i1.p1
MGKKDLRAILSKSYAGIGDSSGSSSSSSSSSSTGNGGSGGSSGSGSSQWAVAQILEQRRKAVSKQVVAHNGAWMGGVTSTLLVRNSLRFYDWKTKAIVLVFAAYGGVLAGRWAMNIVTGRIAQFRRDFVLASLPANTYLVVSNTDTTYNTTTNDNNSDSGAVSSDTTTT